MAEIPVAGVPVPSGATQATNIVTEKFTQAEAYADAAYNTAIAYLEDLKQIVDNYADINTTIDLDSVSLDPSINLEQLINDAPENPIDNSDYDIDAPTNLFSYSEDPYLSTLLTQLNTKLLDIVQNGGSPIDAATEDAMFARETERNAQTNADAKDNTATTWSERGFDIPGGGLFNQTAQTDNNHQDKMLDKARAIAEETRKVTIQNTQFAWEQANKLEATLMDYTSKSWQRKLDAARGILQEGLEIFKATVTILRTKAEMFDYVTRAYAARAGAITGVAGVQVSVIKGKVDYAIAKANVAISSLTAALEQLKNKFGFDIDVTKAGSQIAQQLTAAALSAVGATASIASDVRQNISASTGQSESWVHNITSEEPSG